MKSLQMIKRDFILPRRDLISVVLNNSISFSENKYLTITYGIIFIAIFCNEKSINYSFGSYLLLKNTLFER